MTDVGDPIDLPSGLRLANRIAKAAMSEQLAKRDAAPSEGLIRLNQRWARGGAGLLITGNVMLDGRHRGEPGNVVIEDERDLATLERWAASVGESSTQLWVQLNHPGRQAPRTIDPHPVAPSAVPMRIGGGSFARPRALEAREIEDIVARFARASAIVKRAGFGGVQVHAAHGYLVSQFLSPLTNLRNDEWGGDPTRRRRFLVEIVRAIRAEVGPDFAISVKLNSADFQRGGFGEDESMEVVAALAEQRIDLLEISGGTYERAVMFSDPPSTQAREAFFLDYAEKVRAIATMPLMVTGGFRTRAGMNAALASGAVDVIGIARPLAVEPDLPRRLLAGECDGARTVELETPSKLLNSLIPIVWYQQQIIRMAAGKEPDPSLSRLVALSRYLGGSITRGRRIRRGL